MARKKPAGSQITAQEGVAEETSSPVPDPLPQDDENEPIDAETAKDIDESMRRSMMGPEADPLASDADVCECHHARSRHRGGKDDCEGNGSEPCDTRCTFFLLDLHETGGFGPEPAASADDDVIDAEVPQEPRPEPVAVDDADLKPKAPADVDVTKLGRTTREVSIPLSDSDTAQLGMRLADANIALNKHVDDAAKTRKALKEEEARLQKDIDEITKQIREGVRTSVVLCFELPNPDAKRVEMYTLDEHTFVGSRPMSDSEHESAVQGNLFGDATPSADSETPIGTGTMDTTPIPIEAECAECGHAQEHHGKDHRPDGCIVDGCPCRGFVALVVPEPPADEPTPEEVAEASEESEEEAA